MTTPSHAANLEVGAPADATAAPRAATSGDALVTAASPAPLRAGGAASSPHETSQGGYDLDADRARRLEQGRKELGARAGTRIVSDTFVFVSAPGSGSESFGPSVNLAANALGAYYNNRFRTPPTEAISVYLFWTAASYEAYCKRAWAEPCLSKYGFFRPQERRIVMNAGLGLGTLTHELVHPIVASDFPNAPTWINEGIASLFKNPIIPQPNKIHNIKN